MNGVLILLICLLAILAAGLVLSALLKLAASLAQTIDRIDQENREDYW